MAHVAKILHEKYINIILYMPRIGTYVEVKIVFETHKDPTYGFFPTLLIFYPVVWNGNSGKSQTVLHTNFVCNLCGKFDVCSFNFKATLMSLK